MLFCGKIFGYGIILILYMLETQKLHSMHKTDDFKMRFD